MRDDRIVVYLNGTKINEWINDDPNVDLATGHIGLQTHGAGDDVYFRNVQIKDLTPVPLATRRRRRPPIPRRSRSARQQRDRDGLGCGGAADRDVQLKSGESCWAPERWSTAR